MARHGAAPHELEKWPAFPLERNGTATAATTIPRLEIEIERERERLLHLTRDCSLLNYGERSAESRTAYSISIPPPPYGIVMPTHVCNIKGRKVRPLSGNDGPTDRGWRRTTDLARWRLNISARFSLSLLGIKTAVRPYVRVRPSNPMGRSYVRARNDDSLPGTGSLTRGCSQTRERYCSRN